MHILSTGSAQVSKRVANKIQRNMFSLSVKIVAGRVMELRVEMDSVLPKFDDS